MGLKLIELSTTEKKDVLKRLVLSEGQIFGEDNLIKLMNPDCKINDFGYTYTVRCESGEGELLYANAGDIIKFVKNERKL